MDGTRTLVAGQVPGGVGHDRRPIYSEKRSNERQVDPVDAPDRFPAHAREPSRARASEKMHQGRLDAVVGVMGEKDPRAIAFARHRGDRPIAQHGTPFRLLVCEFEAVGYKLVSYDDKQHAGGYLARFEPEGKRPKPDAITVCDNP